MDQFAVAYSGEGGPLPWVEKDGFDGFSDDSELVEVGDQVEPGVVVLSQCSQAVCNEDGDFEVTLEPECKACTWGSWGQWSQCTKTCGQGVKRRTRPEFFPGDPGVFCPGSMTDTSCCNTGPCQEDGNWSPWGEWSNCSASCGAGVTVRSRTCTNPPPSNGGDNCEGSGMETESCDAEDSCEEEECPDGKVLTKECDLCPLTCDDLANPSSCVEPEVCEPRCRCPKGKVMNDIGNCIPKSQCTCAYEGKFYPPGYKFEKENCEVCTCTSGVMQCEEKKNCDIDCGYGEWSDWQECTKSCGKGEQTRSRISNNPPGKGNGKRCDAPTVEARCCNEHSCPECEVGTFIKTLYPVFQTINKTDCNLCYCAENAVVTCEEIQGSEVNGGYSEWGEWSECDKSCGDGKRSRLRFCNNPAPKCGGAMCSGINYDLGECNNIECETPECGENEIYTEERCEPTCESFSTEVLTCQTQVILNGCACKEGYHRKNGKCVTLDECFSCQFANGTETPQSWTDENDICIQLDCIMGSIRMTNQSESCSCASGFRQIPSTTECCSCEPEEEKQETEDCALHTIENHLEFTDLEGKQCKSKQPVLRGICMGKCSGEKHGSITIDGLEVSGFSQCNCCTGDGDFIPVEAECGGSPIQVKVKSMQQCSCNVACNGQNPFPTTPCSLDATACASALPGVETGVLP